ncbi:thioredoxin domain-containing protein [Lysinibacillus sp. 3P01SB]|uniref:thioredoxin domain-containing protein n=1 Tax=Lysinibacillus sp. 3P01SB TaxID=3132284 RepID=UPI0039A6E27D
MDNKPRHARPSQEHNWLIETNSPYLLQHAHQPINWYPWGDEAFERAMEEKKPIFLSIGYATCHWCHQMARESFEDQEIANYLNEHYIAIKVDREERPDIDNLYMNVCIMMDGHGGWPLSIFMTPEQVPFYAGTYYPKKTSLKMVGFHELIVHLHKLYEKDQAQVISVGAEIKEALMQLQAQQAAGTLPPSVFDIAFEQLYKTYDNLYGGFGRETKFPMPHQLMFLLRFAKFNDERVAEKMALNTLQSLYNGGIYDQIGFGFSRYSVDETYIVPHFEKMLYDNALLLYTTAEAYQVSKDSFYEQKMRELLTYIRRVMTSPEGGFYSAEDADTEQEEGKFYTWTRDEVMSYLGEELGEIYCQALHITAEGNFVGKNVPHLVHTNLTDIARENGMNLDSLQQKLEKARQMLFEVREQRMHPNKDDKILTSWNGLMIAALAKANAVLQDEGVELLAVGAMRFLEEQLFQSGRLMRRYRNGEVKEYGILDDYAAVLWAYTELYEATFSPEWLQKAIQLADAMIELFWDHEEGGFFMTGSDAEALLIRQREIQDGAIPSGSSIAAVSLIRLARLTNRSDYEEKVITLLQLGARTIYAQPEGFLYLLISYMLLIEGTKEVIMVGKLSPEQKQLLSVLKKEFQPNTIYLYCEDAETYKELIPTLSEYQPAKEGANFYICKNYACQQPVHDPEDIQQMLEG